MKYFIGNLPSFYRIEQWNRISQKTELFVIITDDLNLKDRNKDFYSGVIKFNHAYLSGNKVKRIIRMIELLRQDSYSELIVDGWNSSFTWLAALLSPKKKNSCIVESTIYESTIVGFHGLLKRLFLKRMSKAYPCGKAHVELIKRLGFNGRIVETGGCGILNYKPQPEYQTRELVRNFLFVGRLVEVKNLKMLVEVFNELPHLNLLIVGFGDQEKTLKKIARKNISFAGAVKNQEVWSYYRNADVFILPSKSETWGLVVEEALNNGTPVIVSNKVGCNNELAKSDYGIVFRYDSKDSLKKAIVEMTNVSYYNSLRNNISKIDFAKRAQHQIDIFTE